MLTAVSRRSFRLRNQTSDSRPAHAHCISGLVWQTSATAFRTVGAGQQPYLPMIQTWAPFAAKACAVASPMPAEPPAPGHFLVRPLVYLVWHLRLSSSYGVCVQGAPAPVTSTLLPARSSYFPMTGDMALTFAGSVVKRQANELLCTHNCNLSLETVVFTIALMSTAPLLKP